ncbi:extracellular solute-binding protein [Alkalihalobacillus sp. LMS39]|uniref:extracellular solute-binding protein n=1 Tax=Alkalihalobacillus sp. LMS39 TaxID=2924032 RepID=UPI001FB1E40A|nr:extracellular solute-binding protein [Alkalihalobacillus sp. LMS39]UOE94354.1 extracellular solute-binding protein [Alkalihalobacillus sp. LMS39]
MNKFKFLLFVVAILSLGFITACGQTEDVEEEQQPEVTEEAPAETETEEPQEEATGELEGRLVVYSSRNENFVIPLLDKFSEETGVQVDVRHEIDALLLKEEANNVQADIFISNDVGALEFLRMEDLLEGSEPAGVEAIESQYRADDNAWIALSARARGFIYNKDLITEEEMPKTMEALMDPAWEGQFAITRGGNGGMIGNVSALRNEWGDEKTAEWIEAIKENADGIYQGHGDIRRAVGEGLHAFGLVNNYYYHQQLLEPQDNNVGFIYPDQGDGEMGVIANAAGVGLVKGAPNSDNAKAFIEWLLLPENQLAFVGESLEIPINPELDPPFEEAQKLSELKVQQMPLKELGQYFEDTKNLIEDSGLDLELR